MEMRTEVLRDLVELVWSVREGGDILLDFEASQEFLLQYIRLIEEQDQMDMFQEGVGADCVESLEGVVDSVHLVGFFQVLVKRRDWGEEDDSVGIIEERYPGVSLAPRSPDIKEPPSD